MATKKYLDYDGLVTLKNQLYLNLAPIKHSHPISDVDALQSTLNTKIDTINVKTSSDTDKVTPLTTVNGKVTLLPSHLGIDASLVNTTASALHVEHAVNADKATLADDATKLKTPRNIVLNGAVTGSVSFDGSSNVTITTTVLPGEHQHTIAQVSDLQEALDLKVNKALLGVKNGIATLGNDGLVPATQLPSYVDDVLEFATKADFPPKEGKEYPEKGKLYPEKGKIYVDKSTNLTYRWGETSYVEISKSLATGYTSSSAYPGDEGKALANSLGLSNDASDKATAYGKIQKLREDLSTETTTRTDQDSALSKRINTNETTAAGIRSDLGTPDDTSSKTTTAFGRIAKNAADIATKAAKTTVDTIRKELGNITPKDPDAFTQIATLKSGLSDEIQARQLESDKLSGIGGVGEDPTVVTYVTKYAAKKAHTHTSSAITDLSTTIETTLVNNATTASKLSTSSAGSTSQPVYFDKGIPVAISYTILSNVPSNAKFTDTTYNIATSSTAGLMSASDRTKLDGIDTNANKYEHPNWTAYKSGLYKVTVDALGHVTAATDVTNSDIIPIESKIDLIASTSTASTHGAASNPYIILRRSGAEVNHVQLIGSENVQIESGAAGAITFTATDTVYTHPKGNEISALGLYKVTTDATGHVQSSQAATTSDIFALNTSNLAASSKIASQSVATSKADGLMSASDKEKLDSVKANAGVTSIGGFTGVVTKADLALNNVNNTADTDKNVATARTLANSRTFSITGDCASAVGVTFDGSKDVALKLAITSITETEITDLFNTSKTAGRAVAAMMAMR